MHELSIATDLLKSILAVAAEKGADRVEEAVVEIGVMRQVLPESLELAFEVIARGTPAESATIKVVDIPIQGKCRNCELDFHPTLYDFLCPRCGDADVEIKGGNDVILKSVTLHTQDEQ
ncbi:MAG: hydrogenase maturation nickel metallochaperone HypA [Planctomycetes bacterium]|nr:hydrogenase maturation nickel metallochaperone HypA [Planctomycetota bacterium]